MNPIRKNFLTLCFILFGFTSLLGQNIKRDSIFRIGPVIDYLPPPDSMKVYNVPDVQIQPQFSGDIKKYLADSIKYPDEARKKNIQGVVYISFIIEKNGTVSTVAVLRSSDTSLSNEAKRVVSTMPKWTQGKQNGEPVRVQEVLPVHFKL
jgi:periplasmic protein TonB